MIPYMVPYMVGKLAPNPTHFTRGFVKFVPGRVYFRAVPSQTGDKIVTSLPLPIVERLAGALTSAYERVKSINQYFKSINGGEKVNYFFLCLGVPT